LSRDETATSEIGFRERGLFEDFFDEFGGKGRTDERKGSDDEGRRGGHVGRSEERREGKSRKKQSDKSMTKQLFSYTFSF